MKVLIVLLALVPLVWGEEIQEIQAIAEANQRSIFTISTKIINSVKRIRDKMPCGFPELGIPPLVPLQITNQINTDTNEIQVLSNTLLYGFNDFKIVNLAAFLWVNFNFNWNNVYLLSHYNVSTARNNKSQKINGTTQFSIKDFTASGTLNYRISFGRKLSITYIRVKFSLGEVELKINNLTKNYVINQEINNIIEKISDFVSELINDLLVPYLNKKLYDKTIWELSDMTHAGQNETCVPPHKDSE